MTLFSRAVEFAEGIHSREKKNGKPYLYHPMAVASLILKYGGDSNQMVAGLLHDTIFREGVTKKKISENFGEKIADLTFTFLDPPLPNNADWRMTKQAYLDKVKALSEEKLLLVACEELHEVDELLHSLQYDGVTTWDQYPVHGMEVAWYFKQLLLIFYDQLKSKPALVAEFAGRVRRLSDIVFEAKTFT